MPVREDHPGEGSPPTAWWDDLDDVDPLQGDHWDLGFARPAPSTAGGLDLGAGTELLAPAELPAEHPVDLAVEPAADDGEVDVADLFAPAPLGADDPWPGGFDGDAVDGSDPADGDPPSVDVVRGDGSPDGDRGDGPADAGFDADLAWVDPLAGGLGDDAFGHADLDGHLDDDVDGDDDLGAGPDDGADAGELDDLAP
jgi:hypothetical protein